MKAIIFAAGRGERLRPLTDKLPKPLLPLEGIPLIQYHIDKLVRAGVTDILINTAWLGHFIEEYIAELALPNVRFVISHEKEGALETAGGIINAIDFFDEQPFFAISGDVFSDVDYGAVMNSYQSKPIHLVLVENPQHHPLGDFSLEANGSVSLDGDNKFTYSGISILTKALFNNLPSGKQKIGPIFRKAIENKSVSGILHKGQWTDVGTVERYETLKKQLENK